MGKTKFRYVVIGNESLLIQCCEELLTEGHDIITVVSSDSNITNWASDKGIEVHKKIQGLAAKLPPFDYLLSIANLLFLPKELIELPEKGAINFHDGPLPKYAGLNTPNWALINQEKTHGITWHLMTEEVDAGDILKQRIIDIDESDTAFTLNAKCYDAAAQCFVELIHELSNGSEQYQPQDFTNRTLYSRDQRPDSACVIDWTQPAEQIWALVRALNFDTYKNPFGCAKVTLGNYAYVIAQANVLEIDSNHPPGYLLEVDNTRIVINTPLNAIAITKLKSMNGSDVNLSDAIAQHSLAPGVQLAQFTAEQRSSINAYVKDICTKEDYWADRLKSLEPVEPPINGHPLETTHEISFACHRFSTKSFSQSQITAIFGLYLARTSGKDEFDLAFNHPSLKRNIKQNIELFSSYVPLHISVNSDQPVRDFLAQTIKDIDNTKNLLGYSLDLIGRFPELRTPLNPWHQQAPKILISQVNTLSDIEDDERQHINRADITLVIPADGQQCMWCYNQDVYCAADIQQLQNQFLCLLNNSAAMPNQPVKTLPLVSETEQHTLLKNWTNSGINYPQNCCVHQIIEEQAHSTPNAHAIVYQNQSLTYNELNNKANQIAHSLISNGVTLGSLVGVMLDRSLDLVPAMIGIWKAGAAYVPLDPSYPKDRLAFMAEDARLAQVITTQAYKHYLPNVDSLLMDEDATSISNQPTNNPGLAIGASELSYIIYTSGSTGKPKGVMVEHRNVLNFFAGMDERIHTSDKPGVWLAVTSISFDISVLELFWTLSRGFKVVIYNDTDQKVGNKTLGSRYPDIPMDFSLFYWNIMTDQNKHEQDKYRLLMESAKYGDNNNFKAVWTPERHFGSFGGAFPNPSVISAALAVQTKNIEIRAGSCVLPLHSPIRVAEEWAVVDNLSNGRVALGIAAGWQPNDFVIKPENHADAKGVMFESINQLKRLWRGESVMFPGPDGSDVAVETLPRPIQAEIPIWITVAGNPDTYIQAGKIGANILTHLLGQSIEQVASNIKLYRQARKEAGHAGDGHISLLLHTLVGDSEEEVKELSRQPMKDYLLSAVFLVKAAAWHFPTFKELSEDTGKSLDEYFATISDDDLDGVLEFAFERYYTRSGLFGTPERCLEMVDHLKEIGVNEIGCLIDYGLATDKALAHLPNLNEVRKAASQAPVVQAGAFTIPDLIKRHGVTHFQCTPSMASMLASDAYAYDALAALDCMMVGGEALPNALAEQLKSLVQGKLINMYGPTETTIWSSTYSLTQWQGNVPLGRPVANTQIHILDQHQQVLPQGIAGEIIIAGDGVTRGYLHQTKLTEERFINVDIPNAPYTRMYRTGDLGRITNDGNLEFLGRIDHQVKILGYRIEVGEIENAIHNHPDVKDAVVIPQTDTSGARSLVGYVIDADSSTPVCFNALKDFIRKSLPEYMVPGMLMRLDAFPLTPNGKIDRKALPTADQAEKIPSEHYVAPDDDLEQVIADIWKDVLGRDRIGVNDNFFDLGGHSLLVVQALTRLRQEVNPDIQIVQLFQHTTIKALVQHLKNSKDKVADTGQSRAQTRKAAIARRRQTGRRRNK